MKYKFAIAITGGIATGKSTAVSLLKKRNYEIIDADEVAHLVSHENRFLIAEIFGSDLLENDKINRKKLGSIVFNDKNKLIILNKILHPLIRVKILESMQILESKCKFYFVDIPLFFETKAYNIDRILLIYANKKTQIERIMNRDNLSKKNAIKRIQSQISIEKKRVLATDILYNVGNIENLENALDEFLAKLGGL